LKRHITPIPADAGLGAEMISLDPGAVHRYSDGRRGDGVVNIDIIPAVGIPRTRLLAADRNAT
jgi:hypothetical protein